MREAGTGEGELGAIVARLGVLLGADRAVLRLGDDPGTLRAVAVAGVGAAPDLPADGDPAGRAVSEDRLVAVAGTVAAPVHDVTTVIGSLAATREAAFSDADHEVLLAFAARAGAVLTRRRMAGAGGPVPGRGAGAEQASLHERLHRAQGVEQLGTLAGHVAHDFNNLLAAIRHFGLFAQRVLEADHPAQPHLLQIDRAAEHGRALTAQLLAFSRTGDPAAKAICLPEHVRAACELGAGMVPEGVELVLELADEDVRVAIDTARLRQVVLNLLDNAGDATSPGGRVEVAVTRRHLAEGGAPTHLRAGEYAVLTVRDTGVGMDDETMARALDPMYTTKPPGQGTGFGLAIVAKAAEEAGGSVVLQAVPDEGTTVEVLLPCVGTDVAGLRAPAAAAARRHQAVILLVDREEPVQVLVRRVLVEAGYSVVLAADPTEALAVDEAAQGELDLVLVDNVLPGSSGAALLGRLPSCKAGAPAIVMSAYAAAPPGPPGAAPSGRQVAWLQKPFDAERLLAAVGDALRRPRGPREVGSSRTS